MAQTNHERVGRALELLNKGLQPFIEREMQAIHGERWLQVAAADLREYQTGGTSELTGDTQVLLLVLWNQWQTVFRNVLGHAERSLVSELRETRNKWAHQSVFSTDDAYRALDSIQRLLTAVSAAPQASEVERQKQELLRLRFEEQARNETRKIATAPLGSKPSNGLRAWRDVVTPQPDVASGRFQLAEFAADLAQVHRGAGSDEYRVPRDFFQRTYLTSGLQRLLVDALKRLSGQGGNPVVDLQTNFGGGKTHSLLALYHLFADVPLSDLIGIEPVLQEAQVERPPQTQRAVLVGYELSPGQPRVKPDGCVVYTLWGELAWQLLGKDGYAYVAESDRQGVSPGSEILRELFDAAAPCLILIDEWVVFVRQLYGVSGLPAGTFDANMSFAQSLTEAAKASPRTLVVATIPASDTEMGGEGGREAATRLKNIFGRVESPWRPANTEEGFEIVRRRLFQPMAQQAQFVARDAVAKSFAELYRGHAQEFPSECHESDYERRIQAAYPIHPELFNRLYNDWSSIEKFQRTRGVLRLMATIIHTLWVGQDSSLLILPASIPIEDAILNELMHYVEDSWKPVIEKDVDGASSLPLRLDSENTTLGRYSASRRVARTIYLGSAPNQLNPNKGLTDKQIRLGCVQPGESTATFGDALRRLSDASAHMYQDGQRYWYALQPSVARLAQDRAAQYDEDKVFVELEKRLREGQGMRGDFGRVHVCPESSADIVDDETATRLIILKPQATHGLRDAASAAQMEARQLLDHRGNSRRMYRNTLIFLAADRTRLEELKQGVRQYLAWDSIYEAKEELNLDAFQRNQAKSKRDDADKSVNARIPETYIWLLVPDQPDTQRPDMLQEFKLQPQSPLSENAGRYLKKEEMLIMRYASVLLRGQLDSIPLWRGDSVSIKYLADCFAKYVYLPRLKNTEVLLQAIRDGVQAAAWERETFAYAESWDAESKRYLGLKAGEPLAALQVTAHNLLVKSEVALAQQRADAAARVVLFTQSEPQQRNKPVVAERGETSFLENVYGLDAPVAPIPSFLSAPPKVEEKQYHRFYGSVKLNPRMMAGDAGKIMEEVVTHLISLSKAGVEVTLEIQGTLPNGVASDTVRTVTENCHTLRFESYGFEEE